MDFITIKVSAMSFSTSTGASNVPIESPSVPALQKWVDKCNKATMPEPPLLYGVNKCSLHAGYKEFIDYILDFPVRPDDIWIVTFPKCGKCSLINMEARSSVIF